MPFAALIIESTASNFPTALRDRDGIAIFPRIWAIGNPAILEKRLLGFFCSTRCPGEVILRTYDLARALRHAGVPVISGFHSPMEKECLDLLLRGTQPVVVCPARSLERMRIPTKWKAPLAESRLLILSPFPGKTRRATAGLAQKRNEFVAALAEKVFVAYAATSSKTERFCHDVLTWGKPLLTLENDENAGLLALGARPVRPENVSEWCATVTSSGTV
ncbi:MAG TPA: DNA-processing protein DprA [Candidatus Binatia bacterium]|jgi:predicted Rossmann fold nucleotide-binding protein DprA/Smf involved in DNA uptake|nr:DNA-processing protein DprA [Candidatus Binatia bacterium]